MYYAHQGSSSDNAMTTSGGRPYARKFLAFSTRKEREEARSQIWEQSQGQENLIDASRKEVVSLFGRDFMIVDGYQFKEVVSMRDYELSY